MSGRAELVEGNLSKVTKADEMRNIDGDEQTLVETGTMVAIRGLLTGAWMVLIKLEK